MPPDQLREAVLARLETLLRGLAAARPELSNHALSLDETRLAAMASVVVAANYVRDVTNMTFGPIDSHAENLVTDRVALAAPDLAARGYDPADLDALRVLGSQLLADIFIAGALAGPIPPGCWDNNVVIACVLGAIDEAWKLADLNAEAQDL